MSTKSKQNRRKFLKTSLQSAALAATAPALLSSRKPGSDENTGSNKKMVYRTLGRTGIKLPIVSMGVGDTDNPKLINAAIESGIVLLASSQYYGNGNNERKVGEVIKGYDRDKIIVMTSGFPDGIDHKNGVFMKDAIGEAYITKLEGCLQRLGVDYVDIFILPFVAKRESVFFEPYLRDMEKIKEQGKAKYIGVATHKFEHEAVRAAVEAKIYDVVMTAYNFKQYNLKELNESIDYAAGEGLGIIAMKTMAGVYWDKEKTMPINTKAALKWVLQNENIHTTVPGITTFDELQQDIEIMQDLQLTDEEMKDLKLAQASTRHGIYCQRCGVCLGQCKESLDIPTLMRSYMYAYGYGNFSHARTTLKSADISGNPCIGCSTCNINCKMGFDLKEKITDIARLNEVPEEFLG